MKRYQPPEFTRGGPPARVARVQRLRASGAAGYHRDTRTGRLYSRGNARRAAIRDSRS